MAEVKGYWRMIDGKRVFVKGHGRKGSAKKANFSRVIKSQAEREVARKILREGGILQKRKEDVVEKSSAKASGGGKMRGGSKGRGGSKTTYKGKKAKSTVKRK